MGDCHLLVCPFTRVNRRQRYQPAYLPFRVYHSTLRWIAPRGCVPSPFFLTRWSSGYPPTCGGVSRVPSLACQRGWPLVAPPFLATPSPARALSVYQPLAGNPP